MEGFKQRMLDEFMELNQKREKAELFIASDSFGDLSVIEQQMLKRQAYAMKVYHDTLVDRLTHYGVLPMN